MHRYIPWGWPIAILTLFLLLGGCASQFVVQKVAGTIAKPVLGLVVADSETTMKLIESKVDQWSPADIASAKQCPQAVLALAALRAGSTGADVDIKGFKGVIYHATKERYGTSTAAEIKRHLQTVVGKCMALLPVDKLLLTF